MKNYLSITECGCELISEELVRKRFKMGKSKYTHRFVCREHGGYIIKRKATCIDCDIEFYFGKSGVATERCPDCQKKYHKELVRVSQKKHKKRIPNSLPGNPFKCKVFKIDCGMCVKPYFECKRFRAA